MFFLYEKYLVMSNIQFLTVETGYGKVQGITETNGICAWLGIPYAQAPIGNLRFKAPQPLTNWGGVKTTTTFGPSAFQDKDEPTISGPISEDCLYLNIWSRGADNAKRPVMFWIHGGAYVTGSGSIPMYSGSNLAETGDVVAVTINYRLGPWGFLYMNELTNDDSFDSNVGIRDQIAALKWVKENIEAFGGDPENITIFGESAGGASVINLLGSPAAKGLFHKAIAQSPGGELLFDTKAGATAATTRFLELLAIPLADAITLKTISNDTLLDNSLKLIDEYTVTHPSNIAFQPVVGDDILPIPPLEAIKNGSGSRVPAIVGSNENEGTIMDVLPVPQLMPVSASKIETYLQQNYPDRKAEIYSAYNDITREKALAVEMGGDATVVVPAVRFAEALAPVAPVYMYRFRWVSEFLKTAGVGCFHGFEIPFVFNTLSSEMLKEVIKGVDNTELQNISRPMHQAWINFAHTGNPNANVRDITWEPYSISERAALIFDTKISIENNFGDWYVDIWNQ